MPIPSPHSPDAYVAPAPSQPPPTLGVATFAGICPATLGPVRVDTLRPVEHQRLPSSARLAFGRWSPDVRLIVLPNGVNRISMSALSRPNAGDPVGRGDDSGVVSNGQGSAGWC